MTASSVSTLRVQGVVFDGDDTLWSTEQLYDYARSRARNIVVEGGLDGDEWEQLERDLDVQNVAALGFSVDRFPSSCVEAYEDLCRRTGVRKDPSISTRVREAASSVFELVPPLVPGARETLISLRRQGIRLALLTKGAPEVQFRRIESSGLKGYFDLIRVVAEKTPDVIREVLESLEVSADSAWMVGNSVRSDIVPAIETGMHAIWVKAHVWEYERVFDHVIDGRVATAVDLRQVAELIWSETG
jgi:putative hydrolase of the HAD superfamily